jgi:hypothetical protein
MEIKGLAKYSKPTFKETLQFFWNQYVFRTVDDTCINLVFFINSNAEIRVFKPIINALINDETYHVDIILISNFSKFEVAFTRKLKQSNNVNITRSIYPIYRTRTLKKTLYIVCLDFLKYPRYHKSGIEVIQELNAIGLKTVCIQHGGIQKDNVAGQISSISKYQIVYGNYLKEALISNGKKEAHVFVTGNPLHDALVTLNTAHVKAQFESITNIENKKVILLATCMHTEYRGRDEDEILLYRKYLKKIYESIDSETCFLIIKMHPSDTIKPNLYQEELAHFSQLKAASVVIENNDDMPSFYQCALVSDLILSRSSTVIEEALLLGKNVISFDLFHDGPSIYYKHLETFKTYERVVGDTSDLEEKITSFLFEKPVKDPESIVDGDLISYKFDGKAIERILTSFKEIANR